MRRATTPTLIAGSSRRRPAPCNAVSGNQVKQLWIYESDVNGIEGINRQIYRPMSDRRAPDLSCAG